MRAIQKATMADDYVRGGLISIDSREPRQINFVPKFAFDTALRELKKNKIIEIHTFPTEKNKNYESTYRVRMIKAKFDKLAKKLQKETREPDLGYFGKLPAVLKCDGLVFSPEEGGGVFGKTKTTIKQYAQSWSVLVALLIHHGNFVSEGELKAAVIYGWQKTGNRKIGKAENSINIHDIIRNIKRSFKMGKVNDAINPGLIEAKGEGRAYRIRDLKSRTK